MIHIPKIKEATVRHEGTRVQLLVEGKLILDMPWEVADQLSRAFSVKAREAEEITKIEQIAFDQAILLRSGAPLGFTSNSIIQAEAGRQAAWNSDLRRYMPGGIKSKTQFGRPGVLVRKKKLK